MVSLGSGRPNYQGVHSGKESQDRLFSENRTTSCTKSPGIEAPILHTIKQKNMSWKTCFGRCPGGKASSELEDTQTHAGSLRG